MLGMKKKTKKADIEQIKHNKKILSKENKFKKLY